MKIFDFHSHLRPTRPALEDLLSTMDELNIEKSVVVGGGLISPRVLSKQIQSGVSNSHSKELTFDNPGLLEICSNHQDRLFLFYFANPWDTPYEYEKIGHKFFGLKLAPAIHGNKFLHDCTIRLVEIATKHLHPIYLHCTHQPGQQVKDLVVLASLFPQSLFVLGHAGVGNFDLHAVDQILNHKNIHFETSGGFSKVMEYALEKLGSARILFGSEYPLQDPEVEILKLNKIEMCHKDKKKIFYDNALFLTLKGEKREFRVS